MSVPTAPLPTLELIEPRELRIGDLIWHEPLGIFFPFYAIRGEEIIVVTSAGTCEPLPPLTRKRSWALRPKAAPL